MDLYGMGLRPTSPTRPITPDCPRNKHFPRFGIWQKFQNLLGGRDESVAYVDSNVDNPSWPRPDPHKQPKQRECSSARPVGVGLPRQATFKRQNSERRDRLCAIVPLTPDRRAMSMSRPSSTALVKLRSNSVPTSKKPERCSAPAIANSFAIDDASRFSFEQPDSTDLTPTGGQQPVEYDRSRPPRPPSITSSVEQYDDQSDYFEDRTQLSRELDTKWILNLSMHFRDKSDREKFFVTYAETPSRWRRVTVSCDYRNAEPGSLEMDLKELQLQRDKSMQIYEAIRESLKEIKFYDTVTNLKLETSDGRLHVHVTEDVNEIIPYPPISSLNHVLYDQEFRPMLVRESELSFEAHLSGFVYKVLFKGKPYIKKEIPGPDTVDEFLYEVNALHALQDSAYVINLEAIVTDESGTLIKGLLITYAERGAVVDLLYDYKGEISWEHRERWARHAIQGLSDIHEEGFVQGDFTLSNVVVDRDNNARIIDINRRGCPVGWEPPEIAKKIASNQRISMYIGQKSDLYQLGMTLWALAMDDDEPERHDPPLSTQEFPTDVPVWYQEIVRNCLSIKPRDRSSATDLIKWFPADNHSPSWSSRQRHPVVRIRSEKQYIDPAAAVERDDIDRFRHHTDGSDEARFSPSSSRERQSYTWPRSSTYDRDFDSASSGVERPRGRRRISDHDLLLQAQRQSEQAASDAPLVNGTHNEPTPIISISSDGTESHIINGYDTPVQQTDRMLANGHEHVARDASPILSPPISALFHLQDEAPFKAVSDTSDDTPRNRSMQNVDSIVQKLTSEIEDSQADALPHELAGFGTHPNVSRHSLEQAQQQVEQESGDGLTTSIPALHFADSGYDEPLNFGIAVEDEACPDPIDATRMGLGALPTDLSSAPNMTSESVSDQNTGLGDSHGVSHTGEPSDTKVVVDTNMSAGIGTSDDHQPKAPVDDEEAQRSDPVAISAPAGRPSQEMQSNNDEQNDHMQASSLTETIVTAQETATNDLDTSPAGYVSGLSKAITPHRDGPHDAMTQSTSTDIATEIERTTQDTKVNAQTSSSTDPV